MKRKVEHPQPTEAELKGRKYWRSLDELAGSPGFQEHVAREFPEGASSLQGVDRRQFFKLMAASFALGGIGLAAGCRRPEMYILPYGKSVEGVIPGLPQYYATAFPLRRAAIPLLAETHQGRPTKLEGNPSYAPHGGATSLLAQASVLDLYDPDRATTHTIKGSAVSIGAIQDKLASIASTHAADGGAGLAFLAEQSSSPTREALVAQIKAKFPRATWAEYEPVSDDEPAEAAQAVFGRNVRPLYRFSKAKRILSIDGDFLNAEGSGLYYSREFASGRRVKAPTDDMNRLYVAESHFTITGSMADHRLRLASSHMIALAGAIAARVTNNNAFASLAEQLPADAKPKSFDRWVEACAADLVANRGAAVVVAGAHQPAAVHAIVHAMNAALGAVGVTVDYIEVPESTAASITDLANAIRSGSVKTLLILGGNPAYNAPADLEWAKLQKSVPDVVRYSYYVDETTLVSENTTTQIAATHYLEAWGDARTADGTIVPIQPMILPLFHGFTEIEVLARIAGSTTTDPYTLVYQTITRIQPGTTPERTFHKFLHDGLLEGTAYPVVNPAINVAGAVRLGGAANRLEKLSKSSLEVRFVRDHKMDDGRFANNGWLQECPDPITRVSWDNAILISPRLAHELDVYPKGSSIQVARVENGDIDSVGREMAHIGEISLGGRKVRGPILIQPGLANYTIVVALGYGRKATGHVGRDQGFDAYPIRTSNAPDTATGATLTVIEGERYALANVQNHWSMEGRDIVREANLDGPQGFRAQHNFVHEASLEAHSPSILGPVGEKESLAERVTNTPRGNSLYETPKFTGVQQWGMHIDLNTCIGCSACVIACQAENNIPIVGKDQALRGREMHWIRIDRYYTDGEISSKAFGGDENRVLPEDPQVSTQPVACVHCELAPCETVCPVNATVHDEEGINAMAYNRCIGTRYCANNCPYKVRRFNYFDWNRRQLDKLYLGPLGPQGMPELVQMVKNPNVTVRMRGVMEKCTYCIQRIESAKILAKDKARDSDKIRVKDGDVRTACQQVCPVEAIVFGDILDENSKVLEAKRRLQDYELLGNLNTRPRTTYGARLRNPNPEMPDYVELPFARQEFKRKNSVGDDAEEQKEGAKNKSASNIGAAAARALKKIGGLS